MSVTSEGVKTVTAPQSRPAKPDFAHRFVAALRRRNLAGILSVVGGLLVWEFISRVLVANALFLAAPSQIAVALYNLAVTGQLWYHMGISAT
jgi:ABC-type nitrate/sulfonate/bicarbonate transport system permease component